MPHRIMKRAMLLGGVLLIGLTGTASGHVPCQTGCTETLTATQRPQTWHVPGRVGEKYILYLDVYEKGEKLDYRRLAGGCYASYSSPDVAAVIHACGTRSALRYVALDGSRKLQITYSYQPR